MVPWKKVLGSALIGAVLAGIITLPLTYLDYLYFFSAGAKGLGEQMIPIYIVTVSIAAMLGAVVGAAAALPEDASLIGNPRSQS